ncbi:hypothetical protein Tco_0153087 [Tanacetum coccineum]
MDDPNITMEEYIRLEEEKDRRSGRVYNWETATYGKICPLNDNQIDFRISFDESDDEDYMVIYDKNLFSYKIISVDDLKTDSKNDNDKVNMPSLPSSEPTVIYFDDFDYFKNFEKKFPAIAYNDALTSKLDFSHEPTISPQHIDEFDETSLSEYDGEEQNVIYFNDLFSFNVIYPNDLSDKDNDNDKIDIEQSSWDLSIEPLPNVIKIDRQASNTLLKTIIPLRQKNTLAEYMILSGTENRPPMLDKDLTKKYAELSAAEKIQPDCDMKATNIILQGLPTDIYSLVNHHRVAKDLWERVQLLMEGTSLTKQ